MDDTAENGAGGTTPLAGAMHRSPWRRRRHVAALTVVLSGGWWVGCAAADGGDDAGTRPQVPAAAATAAGDGHGQGTEPSPTLEGRTPGGAHVILSLPSNPLPAGPVRLDFEVHPAPSDPSAVTVDVLAPRMPAHGIIRYPARHTGAGRFEADVEIAMEGLWQAYVNLDVGADAAAFEFHAEPGGGEERTGGHHLRGPGAGAERESHDHDAHGHH